MSQEKRANIAFLVAVVILILWAIVSVLFLGSDEFGISRWGQQILFLGFIVLFIGAGVAFTIYIAFAEEIEVAKEKIVMAQRKEAIVRQETCPACRTRTVGHELGAECPKCTYPF